MSRVFITGATGYIGGDALFAFYQAHPDWEYTALVRSEEKALRLTRQFPTVRVVLGDLSAVGILEEEARDADIVFHFADCDDEESARAIVRGLKKHTPDRPGWYIHTSGMGVLTVQDLSAQTCGIYREKEYNDWEGIGELVHDMPDHAFHRNVDNIALLAGLESPEIIKTAIVAPSAIYGPGRGTGNTRSTQVYVLAETVLKRGKGIQVGAGENIWHEVHIQDLSNVYLALAEAAAVGGDGTAIATWGKEGYYLVENGSFVWGEVERSIARVAYEKGFIDTPEVDVLDWVETAKEHLKGPYRWGSNSRGYAVRARRLLGWKPVQPGLLEYIPSILELEAAELGLKRQ